MAKLNVLQNEISIISVDGQDYISLTDMANARTDDARAADVIKNWIRNRYTIELLGTWEIIHNPDFKVVEFDHFKSQAGLPSFVMSVSDWVEKTNAIGLVVRKGRYGGTYAVRDLAFEFRPNCNQRSKHHFAPHAPHPADQGLHFERILGFWPVSA